MKKLRELIRDVYGLDKDVRLKAIEICNQLFEIENLVNTYNDKSSDLKQEYKWISSEVLKIMGNFDGNLDAESQLDELNMWLENLEEKAFV